MKKIIKDYLGLAFVILLIIINAFLKLPVQQVYLFASVVLLVSELLQWRFGRIDKNADRHITVKSIAWFSSVIVTGMLIYFFTRVGFSPATWATVGVLLISQSLFAIRNRHATYIFGPESFYSLNDSLKIRYNSIRNVQIEDDSISIHTRENKHEFDLERDKLVSPTWENAREMFRSLQI